MKTLKYACLTGALLFTLSGCQNIQRSIQAFKIDPNQKTFSAPSYYGKERPSGFVSREHALNKDNGHRFRGYQIGRRHWKF